MVFTVSIYILKAESEVLLLTNEHYIIIIAIITSLVITRSTDTKLVSESFRLRYHGNNLESESVNCQ